MIDERDRIAIGPPGGLTTWAFHLLRGLAASAAPAVPVFTGSRAKEIGAAKPGEDGRLLLFHAPNRQLVNQLSAHPGPIIFFDEPIDTLGPYLLAQSKHTGAKAIRVLSASYVANSSIRNSQASIVERTQLPPLDEFIQLLANFLAPTFNEKKLEAWKAGLDSKGCSNSCEAAMARYFAEKGIDTESASASADLFPLLSRAILEPMRALLYEAEVRPIRWPTDCFQLAQPDNPFASSDREIDLCGPTRCLYHGPYVHLPPARYAVEAILNLRDIQDETPLLLDLLSGPNYLGRFRLNARADGRYRAQVEMLLEDPIPALQAQLLSERGALNGFVRLESVMLKPIAG